MVALSLFLLVIELVGHHTLAKAGLLLVLMLTTAIAARWLLRDLRVHPAIFPAPTVTLTSTADPRCARAPTASKVVENLLAILTAASWRPSKPKPAPPATASGPPVRTAS
jgi:hypothetical protein